MKLTDAQNQQVIQWIQQGQKLSEIQNRLGSELGIRMTYMDVKMLLADLELKPKDQEAPKSAVNLGPVPTAPGGSGPSDSASAPPSHDPSGPMGPGPGAAEAGLAGIPGASGINVTVDTITRPGSIVSGKVTFSDQKTAEWYLDQTGRLGFAPAEKGYRPSQPDLMAFQTELQSQLARFGY